MDNLTNPTTPSVGLGNNQLWHYVQEMESSTVARLSQPASKEVLQLMEQNIQAMVGTLPPSQFEVMITTDRDNLGRLLAAAMMNGYFLKSVEQRMEMERSFGFSTTLSDVASDEVSDQASQGLL